VGLSEFPTGETQGMELKGVDDMENLVLLYIWGAVLTVVAIRLFGALRQRSSGRLESDRETLKRILGG
jgi:hypothetical protein